MKRCNSFLCAVFRFATFRNDSGRRRARSQRSASPTRWTTFPPNEPAKPGRSEPKSAAQLSKSCKTDRRKKTGSTGFPGLSLSGCVYLGGAPIPQPQSPTSPATESGSRQGRAHILGLVLDWFLAFCFESPATTTTSTTAAAIHGIPLHSDSAK